MLQFFKNLLLFGEGGDGGAGAAPDGAPEGQAAEAGVTVPDAGEQRPKRLTKEERRAKFEKELEAQRAQTQQPQTAENPAAKTPEEEFEELIKGRLKEPYGKAVETAIKGRFKNAKATEDELTAVRAENARMAGLLDQLARSSGIEAGADGKISLDAIEKHNEQAEVERYAYENGVSDEFARKHVQSEKELKAKQSIIDKLLEEKQTRENIAKVQNIQAQAEQLKADFPDIDLDKEMENPRFRSMVWQSGVPVKDAYIAVHYKELTAQTMKYAVNTTKAAAAATIQAGMARPSEGGLGRSAPANLNRINSDPRQLTKEQRKALRKQAARDGYVPVPW